MWAKNYPTSIWHHGYVGAFSIPRELVIKDNDIYQRPVQELEKYTNVVNQEYLPRQADISMKMVQGSFLTIKGDNGHISIGNNNGVYLDNTHGNGMFDCVRKTNGNYDNANVRILLDTSSIELFIEDGKEVISTRFYIDGNLSLITSIGVEDIVVKEVKVK